MTFKPAYLWECCSTIFSWYRAFAALCFLAALLGPAVKCKATNVVTDVPTINLNWVDNGLSNPAYACSPMVAPIVAAPGINYGYQPVNNAGGNSTQPLPVDNNGNFGFWEREYSGSGSTGDYTAYNYRYIAGVVDLGFNGYVVITLYDQAGNQIGQPFCADLTDYFNNNLPTPALESESPNANLTPTLASTFIATGLPDASRVEATVTFGGNWTPWISAMTATGTAPATSPNAETNPDPTDDATQAAGSLGNTMFDAFKAKVEDMKENPTTQPTGDMFKYVSECWGSDSIQYPGSLTADLLTSWGLMPDIWWGGTGTGIHISEGIVEAYLGGFDVGAAKVIAVTRSGAFASVYSLLTSISVFIFCYRRCWSWLTWALYGGDFFVGSAVATAMRHIPDAPATEAGPETGVEDDTAGYTFPNYGEGAAAWEAKMELAERTEAWMSQRSEDSKFL